MENAYVVNGHFLDRRTLKLDEDLPVSATNVRVVVELLGELKTTSSFQQVLVSVRERQRLRGFKPPSAPEIDAQLQAERASWD